MGDDADRSMREMGGAARPLPPLWTWSDDVAALEELWATGGLVAIPTESTYGLAVDPGDPEAVAAVMRVKGRPSSKPLPVVAGSIDDLLRLGVRLDLPELAPVLAAWPAPLTAVVPLARPLAASLGAGTLAVRLPAHPRLCALLAGLGRAVTATSANVSGQPPVVEAARARALLAGERAAVIEEESQPGGDPSTIVAARGGRLVVLREGRFPSARLFAAGSG